MLRNRRIGTSMSGLAQVRAGCLYVLKSPSNQRSPHLTYHRLLYSWQFVAHRGMGELHRWCHHGYDAIQQYDAAFSEWLAVPR